MIKRKAILSIFFAMLLVLTACAPNTNTETEDKANSDMGEITKTINVTAYQYGYEPSEIELKVGETVELAITSSDVDHSFYVKELNIDEKVSPNKETTVQVTPEKVGEYKIICTVYCGNGHKDMTGLIKVVE